MQKYGVQKITRKAFWLESDGNRIFSAGADIRAAGKTNFKTATVRMNNRKVNGKTVSIKRGKNSSLKVSTAPNIRKTLVSYKSSRLSCVSVNSKGRLTAKKAGTAKISITVRASGYKAKAVRVNIRVVDNAETGSSQETDTGTTGTDPSLKPDAEIYTDADTAHAEWKDPSSGRQRKMVFRGKDYNFPNSTKNVLMPFLLSAHIFPLWRFTMDSAIDSPRPKLPVRLLA